MVVRRTDNREYGLAAGWSEDGTTTTYQPYTRSLRRMQTGPVPRAFGQKNLAPALAGAARPALTNMYSRPELSLPSLRELDLNVEPFTRPRAALGASFWNALGFAGLFCAVLIGRVIVQAGQDGTHAAGTTPSAFTVVRPPTAASPTGPAVFGASAATPATYGPLDAAHGPLGAAPELLGAAPGPLDAAHGPLDAATGARDAAPTGDVARSLGGSSSVGRALADAQPTAADSAPRNRSGRAARAHASRARSVSLDWRSEMPEATPSVLPEPGAASTAYATANSSNPTLGTLRINSRPWSQVFLDGRLLGTTPQLDIKVPAGRYTVRLSNPELGMGKTIRIKVAAGELVTRVESLNEQ